MGNRFADHRALSFSQSRKERKVHFTWQGRPAGSPLTILKSET